MLKNYFFRLFVLLLAAGVIFSSYSREMTITTDPSVTDEGVFIGEIEGTPIRWATRNVAARGTFADTPESAGRLFSWNFPAATGWDCMFSSPEGTAWYSANDPCPPGWRVPTIEELTALYNAGSEWTSRNGVYGRYFGTAPNRLFLPAAGNRSASGAYNLGAIGYYWSSTSAPSPVGGKGFMFGSNEVIFIRATRSIGYSVRCVAE